MMTAMDQPASDPFVELRPVHRSDLPTLYEHQIDADAVRMAAVNPRDPQAFEAHWNRILADTTLISRAIIANNSLAGCIGCFPMENVHCVGYWIGKDFWGRGIATRALQLLLQEVRIRPLHATVASHNIGSLRVLQRSGFVITGRRHSPADDRYLECEEILLRLD